MIFDFILSFLFFFLGCAYNSWCCILFNLIFCFVFSSPAFSLAHYSDCISFIFGRQANHHQRRQQQRHHPCSVYALRLSLSYKHRSITIINMLYHFLSSLQITYVCFVSQWLVRNSSVSFYTHTHTLLRLLHYSLSLFSSVWLPLILFCGCCYISSLLTIIK